MLAGPRPVRRVTSRTIRAGARGLNRTVSPVGGSGAGRSVTTPLCGDADEPDLAVDDDPRVDPVGGDPQRLDAPRLGQALQRGFERDRAQQRPALGGHDARGRALPQHPDQLSARARGVEREPGHDGEEQHPRHHAPVRLAALPRPLRGRAPRLRNRDRLLHGRRLAGGRHGRRRRRGRRRAGDRGHETRLFPLAHAQARVGRPRESVNPNGQVSYQPRTSRSLAANASGWPAQPNSPSRKPP